MLSTFLVDGMPDPVRFMAVIGGIIAHAAAGGSRIRAFGEMVALLAQEGNHAGAIRLEALWNELQTRYTFALFCAYPMACLGGSTLSDALVEVCAAHGRVIPSESYTSLPRPDDRLRAVVRWQQKAQSLEQALEAERTARQAAEEALRLRDEFLSIASHELNTPITGLSGHVQFLLRQYQRTGHLEPERLAMSLQRIQEQTGKLSRLMSHLLDASRLEAGKLTLERRPTDLSQLVQDTVATLRILDEDHDITVSMPPSLQAFIDPVRLEQVLINLLHNALKYSPDGSEIGVTLADGEDGAVELAVRDRGPGIPPDKREHLFERFYQVHEHCPKQGMGLGLYISRQIVELHGGTLCAEFPSGGGTRFVVRLPIHDRSQATTDEPEDPSIVSRR
jgi:signal transduction histidine kinase